MPWLKPAVEYGPLAVFVAVYFSQGLMPATVALMIATVIGVGMSWLVTRKVPLMPVVTAVIVLVFGGLTLWLNDENFIKMKPTIIYALFAIVIGGGLALGKSVLKKVLGHAVSMDEAGWRSLSVRVALFFAAMAVANEVVRHVMTTDHWVLWKMPGSLIITLVFMMAQGPLILRHQLDQEKT
ncbi:septation protein A [Magnetospirillum sulfuroxidans]|uniref:Inner membrane-spanning protein YciB n=1 Tax=Magnetospirillum sulfuroxidans TaxID=611300 RepID=A0ABS5IH43_9PROT|nr:septation protein A [Magnetospirillum sulfuroxidans]MBR9973512.1 septation protein A [Magnetospirillum sulfuroxidans]